MANEDEEVFGTFFNKVNRGEKATIEWSKEDIIGDTRMIEVERIIRDMIRFNLTEENTIGDLLIEWRKK